MRLENGLGLPPGVWSIGNVGANAWIMVRLWFGLGTNEVNVGGYGYCKGCGIVNVWWRASAMVGVRLRVMVRLTVRVRDFDSSCKIRVKTGCRIARSCC